ncbi:MAG: EAL domain-containing protein [Lentilitoribacter sp.]
MQNKSDTATDLTIDDSTIASQMGYARGKTLIKFILLLIIAISVFIAIAFTGIQYALNNLLEEKSNSLGMGWAHHLETQFPDAGQIAGITNSRMVYSDYTKGEMAELIDGMFQVGNIYQLDLINPDCNCSITYGSYSSNTVQSVHKDHGTHIKESSPPEEVKPQTASGLMNLHAHNHNASAGDNTAESDNDQVSSNRDEHTHPELKANQDLKSIWPMNMEIASVVAKSGAHPSYIVKTNIANQPNVFGEVYHPVYTEGELQYIIRVLVNLEETHATYTKSLYGGAAFIFVLLVAVASYPLTKYFHTSKAQRKMDIKAHFLATHDVLTTTYNRNAFQDYAPRILRSCGDRETSAIVFLFDLNNFKEINDYYSHHAGDQILRALAQALKSSLPEKGYLARLGGDEFVIIIPDIDPNQAIEDILEIPEELATEIDNGRQIINATVSAGVAIYPRDGSNINELMRNADLALYSAKSESKKQLCEYDAQMGKVFNDRLDLRDEFKFALLESEIEPFYQPLVNTLTGKVESFEALARWRHPKKGILTPGIFGEMLDDIELSAMVGDIMFEKVISNMKEWTDAKVPFGIIGINAGEGDLLRPGFSLKILSELAKNNLPNGSFAIEIVETCMFGNNKDLFVNHLNVLKDAGCRIALDDFGTGYSSITQIKEIPCTSLKIDKSFIDNVVDSQSDRAIVEALIKLGRDLEFNLIMEGIETKEQMDILNQIGAIYMQGFYFAKPMPAHAVPQFLQSSLDERKKA